jgi:hypothetical protein
MIQTLTANTADKALHIWILPWALWRDDDFFNPHVVDALTKVHPVDVIAISRPRLGLLLNHPAPSSPVGKTT